MGVDETSLDRIRNATFPTARRGYDKHEVEKFLARLADWLETGAGDESRSDVVKRELERVGERTGAILAQAEESAQQIRAEAEDEARGTVNMANMEATETRSATEEYANEARASADAYARRAKEEAEQEARETIEAAEAEARRIVEDGAQRREDIEAVIGDLLRRRDEVLADTEELSAKLTAAVAQHRPGQAGDAFEKSEELDPLAREGIEDEDDPDQTAQVEARPEMVDVEPEREALDGEPRSDVIDAEPKHDSADEPTEEHPGPDQEADVRTS